MKEVATVLEYKLDGQDHKLEGQDCLHNRWIQSED
jgi:hypothetical protein